jgi:hypothetical protein
MAEIKIRGDVSGSTTIKAPDSGSDEIIELSSALGSKLPYAFGTATPTTTDSGFLWYDSNSTPAAPKFWTGSAFQALTSGKILQVVRATDSTIRTTTSTSFVDASISVTITPQKSDSAILLVWNFRVSTTSNLARCTITDSSDNSISGAEQWIGVVADQMAQLIGYATPAVATAVTYKGRFNGNTAATIQLQNNVLTGQLFAMEISA